jgi:hypothetical protein
VILTLARGEFSLLDQRGTTEGRYEIVEAEVESASGTRGQLLRFSQVPEFLGDSEFVFNLKADSLFLLTTIDDFTDYAFVRPDP